MCKDEPVRNKEKVKTQLGFVQFLEFGKKREKMLPNFKHFSNEEISTFFNGVIIEI